MNQQIINKLSIFLCIAICIQRLSMALGSVFFGLSLVTLLLIIYRMKKDGNALTIAPDFKGYYIAYAICALSMLPSLLFTNPFSAGIKLFMEMWFYRLVPFFAITLVLSNHRKIVEKMLMIFIGVLSIDCIVAVVQVLLKLAPRGWGLGGNSLHLASILCVVMPMLLVVVLDERFSKNIRKLISVALVCCFMGLIAGGSRGALLTLVIVLPMVALYYILNNKKQLVISLIISAGLVMFFLLSPSLLHRVESISNTTTNQSNISRLAVWESSLNMMEDHPLIGVGLDGFRNAYKTKYMLPADKIELSHAHNNFMQIGAEAGLIGLLGFVYLTLYILLNNFRDWLRTKNPYALMLWSGWLGFIIFGIFDLTIDAGAVTKIWWFLLGALLVLKKATKEFDV